MLENRKMINHGSRRKQLFNKRLNDFLARQPEEQRLHLEGPGTNSLAAWFLGPKAENQDIFKKLVTMAIDANCNDRKAYQKADPAYVTDGRKDAAYDAGLAELEYQYKKLLTNLKRSVPFFSYRYQAHMNWDLTMPGMLGYFSAMLYNQNNVAAEASPVTAQLESQVGDDLCTMLGFQIPNHKYTDAIRPWGHITCDGSVANLEAMWAARNLKYYPISVAQALQNDERLKFARDLRVPLLDGSSATLLKLDTWTLLNLPIDAVLKLTTRIEQEYGIAGTTITEALDPYLLQSMGFDQFCRNFTRDIPPPVVLGSATKHYSWPKNAAILGIGKDYFINVDVDADARMCVEKTTDSAQKHCLRARLQQSLEARQPVIMAVTVMGSTEESAVDPLTEVLNIRDEFRQQGLEFAVHADAAWGGYFASLLRTPLESQATNTAPALQETPVLPMSDYVNTQYNALPGVDSITIDPHKAGYIPYPAGGLCYRNGSMRNLVAFLAPEVFHGESAVADMGIYGVEGSKPGAAAAGVYLSHRIIRPDRSGYGKILGQALFNSKRFYSAVITMAKDNDPFIVVPVQQIPAEKDGGTPEEIKKQLQFIKERIVARENNDLIQDEAAMALLRQLGSDQIIITYAFNFKDTEGSLNTDPDKANEFNHAIFEQLSVSPDHADIMSRPLFITTSEFEPDVYGEDFVRTFMKRLKLDYGKLRSMNFLSSTTMSPWLTATAEGNFIPTMIDAFRDIVLKEVRKFQEHCA
jgi:glutamate/tyrosine decarboxylase-like PLP-dependent enzyme